MRHNSISVKRLVCDESGDVIGESTWVAAIFRKRRETDGVCAAGPKV